MRKYSPLMVQGTTSDAGKTVLVAGLCRLLANKGIQVAPFKPQNMALNSAVTEDGGEIGRAQALQADAARVKPHVHMNPILLKPNTDIGAQVIVQGKAIETMDAWGFHDYKKLAMPYVLESFSYLSNNYECVVIEGAGSPAEINLRENDIANMGFAEAADVPVIIVADIDRGGVFAHLYGTLALLSESEQARVKGFVINRFRGDISLLVPGLEWLEEKTGKPVLGVIPYLHGLNLEAEDAIKSEQLDKGKFVVKVPVVTRISNHTDFDPLRLHPDIDLQFIGKGESLSGADFIILPGSKSVQADLDYVKAQGWDKDIERHLRYGGKVMGICGGYQMLGEYLADPLGIEGAPCSIKGLGYLSISTELQKQKQLTLVEGKLVLPNQSAVKVKGYEIHAGVSTNLGQEHRPISIHTKDAMRYDGTINSENSIFGTYLHGVFDEPEAFEAILTWAGLEKCQAINMHDIQEEAIERIAKSMEESLDLSLIWPDVFEKNKAY
ncbi:cobyric acid synthase [Aliivibrio fischeri]|uniref:cobyric acid synthase n=1 Tax=Aliivibrio fischeri TaxID=668 RepID=UPI00080E358F|nr:cobyric acid synthase [Aliivibrio fischeri]OCH08864.1 cobyric acid synthase CobQ [Aliivibrio fischeri]OCH26773.1 cobyric acid synthase CobQ [Aliivibrio fischeri]OCH59034.1 cobyric acid synthase CobQ [Aliivibrio fischeri]USR97454.1 cobyric acid synthase [Aliivibrio fischeri ATCC 7744 = JCM 18803 = DSM 507]